MDERRDAIRELAKPQKRIPADVVSSWPPDSGEWAEAQQALDDNYRQQQRLPGNYMSMEAALMQAHQYIEHMREFGMDAEKDRQKLRGKVEIGTSIHEALEATIKEAPTPGEAGQQVADIVVAALDALAKISGVPLPALFYLGTDGKAYRLDSALDVEFSTLREASLATGLINQAQGAAARATGRLRGEGRSSSRYPAHQRAARRMIERDLGKGEPEPKVRGGTPTRPHHHWPETLTVPWTHVALVRSESGEEWLIGDYNPTTLMFIWVDSRGDVVSTPPSHYMSLKPYFRALKPGHVRAGVIQPDNPRYNQRVFEGMIEEGVFTFRGYENQWMAAEKFQILQDGRV
jgi:hypothetical protein